MDWPLEFEFAVDSETTKLVSIQRLGGRVGVRVRIAREVVLEEHRYSLTVDQEPAVLPDDRGVTINYTTARLFGLRRVRRTSRF